MKVLGVSGEEQKALWLILGAIYHLGAAGATKGRRTMMVKDRSFTVSPQKFTFFHIYDDFTPKTGICSCLWPATFQHS